MSPKERIGGVVLGLCLGLSFLQAARVGPVFFRPAIRSTPTPPSDVSGNLPAMGPWRARAAGDFLRSGKRTPSSRMPGREAAAIVARETARGRLRLKRVERDSLAGMTHSRYAQYYRGLEVLGGQVIRHRGPGRPSSETGRFYEGITIDTTPLVDPGSAARILGLSLAEPGIEWSGPAPRLLVYPVTDGDYRLAYRVVLGGGMAAGMTGFVDAKSGEVLKAYSNVKQADLTIGLGIGAHGSQFKLPTTLTNGVYWLADYKGVRPIDLITRDYSVSDAVGSDADNIWDHDGAMVSAHAYAGLVYDYFFAVLGRSGLDGADQKAVVSHVHYPTSGIAVWSGGQMYFDTPAAAALDLVGHEYAHGVTENTSGLLYYCDADAQPGALDEAFSDIMGTAAEFYWQDPGQGFDVSDWLLGEDIDPPYVGSLYYGAPGYMRDLSDPNSTFMEYQGVANPYPCHLSQCRVFENPASDWGGVHFNSTLYSHAFYLLAAGGTNRVSGLGVTAIGLDAASKVFYRAWTHYLTPRADYLDAANALLLSASDLYGPASVERAQTSRAMEAIGWVLQ